jgi:2-iminobutanoate/2-iminopropanoate deaminase
VAADGSLPAALSAQVTNVMRGVSEELKHAGTSMNEVCKCTVLLSDMKNWATSNPEYVKFFTPGHVPVRTVAGVNGLAKGAAVEVGFEARARG